MNIKNIHFFDSQFKFLFRRYSHAFSTQKSSLNFYEVLELKTNCTHREIRKNYIRLAKTYHPDVYKGNDKDRFKQIKEAYDTLKIPEKREEYDKKFNISKENEKKFENSFSEKNEDNDIQKPTANIYKDWDEVGKKINIDFEYQKFMGKDTIVKPEEIIISEDPLIIQFSEAEKKRQEFLNMKNNQELHFLKFGHQKSFSESLDDTIEILNERHRILTEPEEKKKEREIRYLESLKKKLFWFQIFALIIIIPFSINFFSQKLYLNKKQKEMIEIKDNVEKLMELELLHNRMVFEGEDNR